MALFSPSNTRISNSLIAEVGIYAAGTTNFAGQKGSAATVLPTGQIRAGVGLVSEGGISAAGTLRATGGFGFVAGNYKKFAFGTYIGTGGATAAITSTGLTTIHGVFMQLNKAAYSGATTGMAYGRPCVAAGTPGSFYPIAFKVTGAPGPVLNTVAGTFRWHAFGV